MEKENKILIFRTSITQRRDIKSIGELLAEFPSAGISLHSKYRKYSGTIIFLPPNWNKTGKRKPLKLPTTVSIQPLLQKLPSELHVSNGKYAYLPVSDQSDTPLLLSVHNEAAPPQDIR